MIGILNAIRIDMDPDMITLGSFVLTWHGFFTFVGVAIAVALVAHWARKENIPPDTILSVSVWAILGGIIGARLVHVVDFWTRVYQNDPLSVFYVWEGGIAIYGAVLGGFVGGAVYVMVRNKDGLINFWNKFLFFLGRIEKMPMPSVGKLADITAPRPHLFHGHRPNWRHHQRRAHRPRHQHALGLRLYPPQDPGSVQQHGGRPLLP